LRIRSATIPVMNANGQLTIVVFADVILGPNGVRTFCRTLLDWSRRTKAVRVVVLTPSRDEDVSDLGEGGVIGVRPSAHVPNLLYPDLLLGYYSQSKLKRIVQSIKGPKVIHIATCGLLGASGAKLARKLNLPSVGCYHVDTRRQCVEPYFRVRGRLAGGIAKFLDKRAYGRCQALCAPSESAADAAKSFYKGEVEVIPNAIDIDRFRPAATREGAFRNKYAPDGKVLAVVVGRVSREKNVDLVCEHLLHDERISTVFVGDGPSSDRLRKHWGAKVTGFLHGDELVAAYQQADLFVQLSVLETFGLTLAEAMAAGLPAVVIRSGGFVGKIKPGNGVEVIEENELHDLANRCVALVEDKERHRQSSLAARALAEQYGPDAVLPKFVELHRSALR